MIVVGSSKLISNRELFHIVLMLHQGSIFWMLPYFIVKDNGTSGLLALMPGFLAGALIIAVCSFWGRRCREQGFVEALPCLLGKSFGKFLALLLILFYMSFVIVCMCSFVEMLRSQLLEETPRIVLLCTLFFLVGWMSWNGLEDMARFAVLCTVVTVLLLVLVVGGNVDVFSLEHLLPVEIKNPDLLPQSVLHGIYGYGGVLALFMIYPALNTNKGIKKQLWFSLLLSTIIVLAWLLMSLGVFGQAGVGTAVWLPLELARMVQLGPFLERTEALFSVLWMVIIFMNGSLLIWCASQGMHQLLEQRKNPWIHWGIVLLLLLISILIKNAVQLFRLEQLLSVLYMGLLPVLLLLIAAGTVIYSKRKGESRQ